MPSSHASVSPLSLEAKVAIGLFIISLAAFVTESQLTQVCPKYTLCIRPINVRAVPSMYRVI